MKKEKKAEHINLNNKEHRTKARCLLHKEHCEGAKAP